MILAMSIELVSNQEGWNFDLYRPFEDFTVDLGALDKMQVVDENNAPIGVIFCVNSQWFFLGANNVNRRKINESFQRKEFKTEFNADGGLNIASAVNKLFFCIKPQNEDFKNEYKFVDYYHKIGRVVLQSPKILRIMAHTREKAILLGEVKYESGAWIFINPKTGETIDISSVNRVQLGRIDEGSEVDLDGTYTRRVSTQVDSEGMDIEWTQVFHTNHEVYFTNKDRTISRIHTIIYFRPVEEVTAGRVDLDAGDGFPVLQVVDASTNGTFVCVKEPNESFTDFPELHSYRHDIEEVIKQLKAQCAGYLEEIADGMDAIDE